MVDDEPCRYPRNQGRTDGVTDDCRLSIPPWFEPLFELLCRRSDLEVSNDLDPDVVKDGREDGRSCNLRDI
jgi:hypothetical protein